MLVHILQVHPLKEREGFLLVEGEEVTGNEMEAPGVQLGGVVELRGEEKT